MQWQKDNLSVVTWKVKKVPNELGNLPKEISFWFPLANYSKM